MRLLEVFHITDSYIRPDFTYELYSKIIESGFINLLHLFYLKNGYRVSIDGGVVQMIDLDQK